MGGGVSRLDNERFVYFPENETMGRRIYSVVQAPNGSMIFGTSLGGVTVFDQHNYTLLKGRRGFTSSKVSTLYYDIDHTLWIGTNDNGIYKFDEDGFTGYSESDGLTGDKITGFTDDTSGNIWIATADSGLFVLDKSSFQIVKYGL